MAKCASVRSVIWLHSSRSIRSRYLQFRASAWKPISVKLRHPDTSNVLSCWLCCESAISERSVSSEHLDTHNFCSLGQLAASCRIDASLMVCKTECWCCNTHDMSLVWYLQLTSQLCRFSTIKSGQYLARHVMALSFICLQPLLLNLRNLTQPRASASIPFSETRWHHDTFISSRF